MEHKKKISIILIALIFFAGFFSYGRLRDFILGQQKVDRYVYPTDFSDCRTVTQRKAKCAIPKEVLSDMTVEELVWAVIDYPFLGDFMLSSQSEGGSEWIARDSDAFAKLIQCRHVENRIIQVLKQALEQEDVDLVKLHLACRLFYISRGKYFDFNKWQIEFLDQYMFGSGHVKGSSNLAGGR